ncbi:hypothetical protein [Parafrankia sp. FMc2]|uniref:hypothetical protein n=1 Tax=Parafrankia sp. FMc2 TaxID=3233196 RepID=UPI0034D41FD6
MSSPDHHSTTTTNHIIDLLAATPPDDRWHAIRDLRARLLLLQRLTVRQLADDDLGEVSRRLGVTKSWVSQLRNPPENPSPWAVWGRALATAGALADLAEQPGARRLAAEFEDLHCRFLLAASEEARTRLDDAARRWSAAARRRRLTAEAEDLLVRFEALVAYLPAPEAMAVEDGDEAEVSFAFHAERAAQRREPGWSHALVSASPTARD